MRKALIAAAVICALGTPALAANSCSVKEYNTLGTARGQPTQIALEPAIADTAVSFSSGHSELTLQGNTSFVRVVCDTQAAYLIGTAPTATTSNSFIPAGLPEYFGVPPGKSMIISLVARP